MSVQKVASQQPVNVNSAQNAFQASAISQSRDPERSPATMARDASVRIGNIATFDGEEAAKKAARGVAVGWLTSNVDLKTMSSELTKLRGNPQESLVVRNGASIMADALKLFGS
jgi:hypothetical protein